MHGGLQRIRRISWLAVVIGIGELACVVVGWRRDTASPAFLGWGGWMITSFGLLSQLHATLLDRRPIRVAAVFTLYWVFVLCILLSAAGGAFGSPHGAAIYCAGALQVLGMVVMVWWFRAIARLAHRVTP